LIRRSALVVIALGVAACANDYDQFDFYSGSGGSTSDAPSDARAARDSGPPDATDDGVSREAEAGSNEGAVDVGVPIDSPGDADVRRDAQPDADSSAVEGASDAPFDVDARNPDVSVVADGSADADASLNDVSVGTDAPADNDGSAEGEAGCGPDQKMCGGGCVPLDDPATGCGNTSCGPCLLPHATAQCDSGRCAVGICAAGFADCDLLPDNGCEASLANDVDHCGACGRACSNSHVLSRECAAGLCVSACELGFGNCDRPATGPDDGCERVVSQDAASCGSCGNDCSAQGAGFVCGGVPIQCGCVDNVNCRIGASTGTCDPTTGACRCGPTRCRPGEACIAVDAGPDLCSCNGGSACGEGETCCQTPGGCRDLQSDPSNCGACGRACPNGLFCIAGACTCNADAQCNAGSPGTCTAGQCVCNGVLCVQGRRCLAGGCG